VERGVDGADRHLATRHLFQLTAHGHPIGAAAVTARTDDGEQHLLLEAAEWPFRRHVIPPAASKPDRAARRAGRGRVPRRRRRPAEAAWPQPMRADRLDSRRTRTPRAAARPRARRSYPAA